MKALKKYLPPLFTLVLIALGAAMPWLAAWGQDARIGKLQAKLELDAVSLTLQKDAGVEPALEVVSREQISVGWGEETQLTEWEALNSAAETIRQMRDYNLLPAWEAERMDAEPDGWAEPVLVIGDDNSSALVWNCYWGALPCVITVDDASGKAVRFLVEGTGEVVDQKGSLLQERTDGWDLFFQDYYGAELAAKLSLDIYEDHVSFNYW